MKKIILLLLFINIALFAQKKVITVTIEPQKFIVEKLVKNSMKVKSIFKGSDFSVRFKKLALKDIAASDVYMTIGLQHIEKPFLEQVKVYNEDLDVFDMSKDIYKMNNNPYVWMDPLYVRQVAKTLFFKLSDMDPKNRDFYRKNYDKFAKELDDLYVKIKIKFDNTSFGVIVLDDYWDYYLSRFDFRFYKKKKLVLNAGEIPSFIKFSQKRNIDLLLVTPSNSIRVNKSLATNASARVVESNIFNYSFMGDMLVLAEEIRK